MTGWKTPLLLFGIGAVLTGLIFWLGSGFNLVWSEYLIAVQSVQRDLHQSLSEALRRVETDGFSASLVLIALSFFYGVFHAAGPGHGKIVISTYLLSHESQLRRGVILSLAAALIQGVTAIVIVTSAVWFLELSMRQTRSMATDVEIASFALIALVGLMIVIMRALRLINIFKTSSSHDDAHHHDHHAHDCNHAHGPTATDLESPLSFRTFIGIVMSIGIRPCSGAVIVLLLAYALNLKMAGLLSVLAMSLGTALTVSLLATISVYLRQTAKRLLVMLPEGNLALGRIMDVVGLIGGVVIFAFGAALLNIALFAPVHPFR
ncbi:nickel/cobalt transporter [Candidatus Puniceispirillum sp.]|uniref:nickel/cobalt transporter n=1 Tax=Candidatus Puniceispirillum sp. TaxID=2026719 RepID=UPI003F6A10A7